MKRYNTISDITNLMGRIGCFNKTQLDSQMHNTYLKESMEDEAYRMGNHHGLRKEMQQDADENTKIEITDSYAILYNASKKNALDSLLKKGVNIEYIGSSAGTYVWGRGIYTNFQRYQAHYRTINTKHLYGEVLIKFKYHGNLLNECLVSEPQLWKEPLSKQVKKFPGLEEFIEKNTGKLNQLDSESNGEYSSKGMSIIREACGGWQQMAEKLMGFGVQGVVFFGHNDRPVAVIYDADKLEILDYVDNTGEHNIDKDLEWKGLKDGEGGRTSNDVLPILAFFKDYQGVKNSSRPQCGELLLVDKKTGKNTFVDFNRAKEIISSQQWNEDPRLFGDFEFEMAQDFSNMGGKEMAFVQIDKDENSQFYIDKEGFLYKEPNGRPFSHIEEYYADEIEPSDNTTDEPFQFDFDGSEEEFKNIFGESIIKFINHKLNEMTRTDEEIVRPLVNNMMSVMDIIERTWKSPDDLYYIKIDQRFKDFRNFNVDKGLNTYDRGAKRWSQEDRSGRDSTKRENHVGYCIVRGRTKEDCKNAVLNATVHLNPWAAQKYGTNVLHSHGGMEAIIEVCHRFFARAYMVINPRSMKKTIDRARADKKIGRFKGREFNHRAGQSKSGFDGTIDWDKVYPDALIDCDISDPNAWKDVEDLLKANGCQIYNKMKSHQGMHFIVNYGECKNIDFTPIMNKYPSFNKPGDPAILLKHDANTMVYSPAGIRESKNPFYVPTADESELVEYAQEWKDEGASFEEWRDMIRKEGGFGNEFEDDILLKAWNDELW